MFGKTKLGWQGEQYELQMTMELVEELDEEVNVLATAIEIDKGGIPKITLVSKVYALLLQAAGADVSKEDVYKSIVKSPADSATLVASLRHALSLCFPDLEGAERGKKGKG